MKISKKEGKINKIIYDNTVYHNGEYRFYPSIPSFMNLLDEIIKADETTKSLTFTPYYRNSKLNRQVEFEEMMFYLECDNDVTLSRTEEFINKCCEEGSEITDDIRVRFCLCDVNDKETFKDAVNNYKKYMDVIVERITKVLVEDYDIPLNELLHGHICIQVDSE